MPNLTQTLRVRKVLYHLRGLPLPVPMTVPEFVLVLLGSVVAMAMLSEHMIASPAELVILGGVVGVLVYALRQESVDGKTPGQWIVTALRWVGSPSALVGSRPDLERDLPVRVEGFVVGGSSEELRSWTPRPGIAGVATPTPPPDPFAGPGWLRIDGHTNGPALPAARNGNGHAHPTHAGGA
jgi:hypothetical protein